MEQKYMQRSANLYKPGDRVRVVPERSVTFNPDGHMDCFLDQIVTIKQIGQTYFSKCYTIDEDNREGDAWCFYDYDFVGLEADETDEVDVSSHFDQLF